MKRSALLFALLLPLLLPSEDARAAASFDSCTGYITVLPAVIGTQGTWCMNKDLATNMSSGNAITVATNNVTIDCNDFKIGGLSAGPATIAVGVRAQNRQNVTVRGCNLRGFFVGVLIEGSGSGHLVENNRLDGNRLGGIAVQGEGMQVKGNRVFDTGEGAMPSYTAAITVAGGSADVRDNLVFNVAATPGEGDDAYGILAQGLDFGRISGNSVRFLAPDAGGTGYAVAVLASTYVVVDDNHFANPTIDSVGVACDTPGPIVRENYFQGFGEPVQVDCSNAGNSYFPE